MSKSKITRGLNKTIRAGSLDERYIGAEPIWDDIDELNASQIESRVVLAHNWYNYIITDKDKIPVVTTYLASKNYHQRDIRAFSHIEHWRIPNSVVALCRMFMRGFVADKFRMNRFESKIDELISYSKKISNQKKKIEISKNSAPVLSIKDYVRITANNYIADLEEKLDEFIKKFQSEFNCYDWLSSYKIKPMIAQRISEYYLPKMLEINDAISKKSPDLVEGYSRFSKKQMIALYNFHYMIVKDCETWNNNFKGSRKPRKKREKSVEKQIKGIKYQKEDTALKIVSIDPTKIIGANEVWLFNTKYRVLHHYVALDRSGLQMRGTTLKNYEEKQSMGKKLRKPNETLPIILNGGIKSIVKAFDKLKTKSIKANGRINENTLILRIVK